MKIAFALNNEKVFRWVLNKLNFDGYVVDIKFDYPMELINVVNQEKFDLIVLARKNRTGGVDEVEKIVEALRQLPHKPSIVLIAGTITPEDETWLQDVKNKGAKYVLFSRPGEPLAADALIPLLEQAIQDLQQPNIEDTEEDLLLWEEEPQERKIKAKKGQIIHVIGPKGGVGRTTIATSLAFLCGDKLKDTIIVDVCPALNAHLHYGVNKNMQLTVASPTNIKEHVSQINKNLDYIGGPYREDLIQELVNYYDFVIVDHPAFTDIEQLNGILVLVINQDLQNLENLEPYMPYLNQMIVVLNQFNINAMPVELIQGKFGLFEIYNIPRDEINCINALAGEEPVVKKSSDIALALGELLARLGV